MQSLNEKTAIVTGAGSGLGAGIATVLGAEGATVIVADLDCDRAAATVAALARDGLHALVFAGDVSKDADVRALVQAALDATGRVDILASNAGIYPTARIEEATEELWDRVMAVNAKAGWMLMRAVAPVMRRVRARRRRGDRQRNPSGHRRHRGLRASAGGTGFFDLMLPSIPAGRIATSLDLGWAVRLLASAEASYITGVGLVVDGGQTIPEGGATNDQVGVLTTRV